MPLPLSLTLTPNLTMTRYGKGMSEEERSAITWLESAVADGLEWHRGKQLTHPNLNPNPNTNPNPSPSPSP